MTSKTSLFNKGIFKSTVRRYLWGAALYAIILFMMTSLTVLLGVDKDNFRYFMAERGVALILDGHYIILPIITALFVPTVVALLAYRFVHSKKTSIFVHSLPVSRTANYISTLMAALTLMGIPIILNGIVLMILSLSGYGAFFDINSCLVWMGVNLLAIFLMFSISAFAAMITGNSFAMVGLSGLIHCVIIIFAAAFSALAECFVYGYSGVNEFLNKSTEWNFTVYLVDLADYLSSKNIQSFDWLKLLIMVAIAVAFYVFGWLLYKKRRMETAEDVAAFGCLNFIYKYLVTFIASLGAFAIFSYMLDERPMVPVVVTAIVSIIIYFIAEMILRKSLKVWNRYKGYLAFATAFAAMICVFAFTSFFGYETRVPDISDIEDVAIYEYYYQSEMPWINDEEITSYTASVHEELVQKENIYTVKKHRENYNYTTNMHIRYKLKNGKTLVRRYPVSEAKACEILENLYKLDTYKRKIVELFDENIGEIYNINLNHHATAFNDKEMMAEFYSCLEEDIMSLDYTQMHENQAWDMNVIIEYVPKKDLDAYAPDRHLNNLHLSINANYTKTIQWLRENGFENQLFNTGNCDLCVLTNEQWKEYTRIEKVVTASYGNGSTVEVQKIPSFSELEGVERISDKEEKRKIAEFVTTHGVRFVPNKEYSYYVCAISADDSLVAQAAFYEDGDLIQQGL